MHSVEDLMEAVAKWEGVRTRYIEERLRTTMDKLSESQKKYEIAHWNESWPGGYNLSDLVDANADLLEVRRIIPDGLFTLQQACSIVEIFEPMCQGVLLWRYHDAIRRRSMRMSLGQVKIQWVLETDVFDTLRHRPAFAGKLPPKTKWVVRSPCDLA